MTEQLRPVAIQREQEMRFGTQLLRTGVRFRLWAPQAGSASVKLIELGRTIAMKQLPRGWFELEVEDAQAGMHYFYVIDGKDEVPDPVSRFQPDDAHGPSEIINPREFSWTDLGWRGRPWNDTVIYEMHVGTFTPEGTFRAAINKLDYLVELGITCVEIMPVGDFPGRWNWGYDGVLLFAPDSSYGRPEDFKAFVDAAHARKLNVFLDVVYNHFGPEGNYLSNYAPLLTDKHTTPWGAAINFDDEGSAEIRSMVFSNALYWINEFHLDGLRFDAVHAIKDDSTRHLLRDLAELLRGATDGRDVHLMLENDDNHSNWLKRRPEGETWLYNAQWSDDIHHVLHATYTGEDFLYYADYAGHTELVGRALAQGFAYQGERLPVGGRDKGEPSRFLPPTAFVAFAQNHDQVGNRPFGERLGHLLDDAPARAWTAINLLSPHIPMIFMGEEWNARQPFPFFSDLAGDIGEAIRKGRKRELESIPHAEDAGDPPDPMAKETFEAAKLVWKDQSLPQCASRLSLFRELLELRQREIVPRLEGVSGYSGSYRLVSPRAIEVRWTLGDQSILTLTANFSAEEISGKFGTENMLWLEGHVDGATLGPWAVLFTLSEGFKSKPS